MELTVLGFPVFSKFETWMQIVPFMQTNGFA